MPFLRGASLVLLAGLMGCAPSAEEVRAQEVAFELTSLDGEVLGPADYLGQVLVVDFWATWCHPCIIQHEVLTVLAREFAGQEVAFLAVNSGESEELAREFANEHPFEFPVLLDSDAAVSDRLGVLGLPTLLILDREGRVSYFEPGLLSPREIRERLKQAGA